MNMRCIPKMIIYIFTLLFLFFDKSISLATPFQAEVVKSATSSSPLYGGVSETQMRALSQYAQFGFLAVREGTNELPAKITNVTLHGMAYWQGLKVNDSILKANATKNMLELTIQRDGKSYLIALTNEHPFTALQIANTGLNGIVQKNYGDCWFDAALAAVASTPTGQNLIASMIRQASPGSYYVSFLDQPDICWPVKLSTIQHYQLEDKVLWASLLEQACLLRFRNEHDGGQIELAMKALTGKIPRQATSLSSLAPYGSLKGEEGERLSIAQMADIINGALLNHEPIAIGTKSKIGLRMEIMTATYKQAGVDLDSKGRPTNPNFEQDLRAGKYNSLIHMSETLKIPLILWGNHAYTVVAFDPTTNMITLRNPFGTEERPAPWAGNIDMDERKRLVQDLGQGYIKLKLDTLYPYIGKLIWTTL